MSLSVREHLNWIPKSSGPKYRNAADSRMRSVTTSASRQRRERSSRQPAEHICRPRRAAGPSLANHVTSVFFVQTTVPKGPVVVIGHPLHQVKHGARQAANGTIPVVSHPHVQVSGVKVLKVLIEGYEILRRRRKNNEQLHSETLTGCHKAAVGCQSRKNPKTVVMLQAEKKKQKKPQNIDVFKTDQINLLCSTMFGDFFLHSFAVTNNNNKKSISSLCCCKQRTFLSGKSLINLACYRLTSAIQV